MHRVVVVVYDGFQLLDLAGPADVFAAARVATRVPGYRIEVVAAEAGPVTADNGVTVVAGAALRDVDGPIGTLIVAGGWSARRQSGDDAVVTEIARLAPLALRTASVCTGAYLLAAAGVLTGRRATTHWTFAEDLRARFPGVDVDPDPIYVRDGPVWTSAGVTSGVDLALALISDDLGPAIARGIARGLVVYLHRPGGQTQFSTAMLARLPPAEPMRAVQGYIDANPAADLSVTALARRAGMSTRHFSRVFTAQTGIPPGRYVERSRAEAARRMLEETTHPLDRVARETGLGAPETLHRAFRRHWRVTPGDYRRRFR